MALNSEPHFYDPKKFTTRFGLHDALGKKAVVRLLKPGIALLELPLLVERHGQWPSRHYLSRLDLVRLSVGNPGTGDVCVELWSRRPVCQDGNCQGCAGCMAPEVVIDPNIHDVNGRPQGLYAINERQMRENPSGSPLLARTLFQHFWTPGTPATAPNDLLDHGRLFTVVADTIAENLDNQISMPASSSELPDK